MSSIVSLYQRLVGFLSGTFMESVGLLFARIALALVFWRSYKTKVVEGTWLEIDEVQYFIFENEFAGLPIPTDLAVPMATYAEFLFPLLLFAGLFTRFSAVALMIMALTIQLFVFPTADHFWGWAVTPIALALVLISRGGGLFGLDRVLERISGSKAA
ncbi:MAG: DoxX family protein [Erythrobacter sp.]|nr:DoxX family protein [Erythrobacter sp.]